MSNAWESLQSRFTPTNRFANFGSAIVSIHVSGIRCHLDTTIELNSPITAFSGLNGTGKSTVLQLAACAYVPPSGTPYRVSNFIIRNQLDQTSLSRGSSVRFMLCNETGPPRSLTLRYTGEWSGYRRRTARYVFFAGIGRYLPRSESPSFINRARCLQIHNSAAVTARIREWTGRVLAQAYDEVITHHTNVFTRQGDKLTSVNRSGVVYSESNMGFGEARTLHLIHFLETIPEKSLVLIEEPETSLHLSAQHEFGHYLVDVCLERHHQILLTTHSDLMLQALPTPSRIYLDRRGPKVVAIPGLTAGQARSLMAEGKVKALNILVEDEVGKAVLANIIRRHEPGLISTWGIHSGGDKDRIATAIRCLKGTGIPLAAVRDPDMPDTPKDNIFKLPGSLPPEKEIFQSPAFEKHLNDVYAFSLSNFRATLCGTDHHNWFPVLATKLGTNEKALLWEAARVYVSGLPEIGTSSLVALLKEASQQRNPS